MTPFAMVGLDHLTAPLAIRESLSFSEAEAGALINRLAPGQMMVLSTCNRTEIYGFGLDDAALIGALREHRGALDARFFAHLVRRRGESVVRHLFRVASGLESQVVGETEILGQVRRARSIAHPDSELDTLLEAAIVTARRVHGETQLSKGRISVASLAVNMAHHCVGLSEARVAVVGTGEVSQAIVRELTRHRPKSLMVLSRSAARSTRLAQLGQGTAIRWEALGSVAPEMDVIFTATAGSSVLERPLFLRPNGRPLLTIDLGVPRNVAESGRSAPGIQYVDVDDLKALSLDHQEQRENQRPDADWIVEECLSRFVRSWRGRKLDPILAQISQLGERIRVEQLGLASGKLGGLSEREMRIVDTLTRRIVSGIIDSPMQALRESSDQTELAKAAKTLFQLDPSGSKGP